VNTGGLSDDDARRLQERSRQLGAAEHLLVEAREDFFNEIIQVYITSE
jgi:argininosuccinate synthase